MSPNDSPRPHPLRLHVRAAVAFALASLCGCTDPVMAEAVSPASRMELAPVAPPQAVARRKVAIVPLGEVNPRLVEAVRKAVGAALDADVEVEAVRPLPKEAYYAPRKRYRAEKLLDALDADPPEGAWKVLGLVDVEISTTKGRVYDWGIGGLGDIGGRSAVVSTYLVRKHSKGLSRTRTRLGKLALHELGHTLGLPHCEAPTCVMADAKGRLIRSLDRTEADFCERCRKVLPRAWLTRR